MKAGNKDFVSIAPKAAKQARVFFFCGPDEAGVQDAATRIVSLLADPGERIDMAGSDLRKDPVLLGDEARSISLFGDTRHIWVRAQGDEAHDAVANLLAGEGQACPVLILASAATDKSRTAKLLEKRDDALVAMFYAPDLRTVTGAVRTMADAAGLRMPDGVAERVARSAGLDTRIAQSEVTKLALYLDAGPETPRTVDAAALDAIGAHTEEDGFMPVVNAVLSGQAARLPGELRRMRELGINPVGLLLAFERRTAQLAGLASRLGPRGDVQGLIKSEAAARRIFWKEQADLEIQLRKWSGPPLERLVDKLVGLHRALLSNSQDSELLLAQGLGEITRVASRKR